MYHLDLKVKHIGLKIPVLDQVIRCAGSARRCRDDVRTDVVAANGSATKQTLLTLVS